MPCDLCEEKDYCSRNYVACLDYKIRDCSSMTEHLASNQEDAESRPASLSVDGEIRSD